MTLWRAGAGGDRVHFHDEVLDLAVLVFTEAERIYAEVALTGLGRPEPFRQVLGPFAHLAAVADAVTGYLIRVEAEDDYGVITVRQVPDADLPQPPAVPAARLFSAEMMSPRLAADLMWEAQQLLDTGEDPAAGLAMLEAAYRGERYDAQDLDAYRAQCSLDLLAAITAAETGSEPGRAEAQPQPVESAPTEPVVPVTTAGPAATPPTQLRPIATQPRLDTLAVPAVPSVGTGHVTNMPRAAVPRTSPFVPIDWSTLPVHIVEERLSRELSLLRASWRGRAAARA